MEQQEDEYRLTAEYAIVDNRRKNSPYICEIDCILVSKSE